MAKQGLVHKSIVVPSIPNQLQSITEQLLRESQSCNLSQEESFALHMALEESLFNAARHGNKLDPDKNITIDFTINSEKIDLTVTDQGDGFDPEGLPDPRKHENLYKYGGRGVLLMRSYMDLVEFNQKGNQVHMVKYRRH